MIKIRKILNSKQGFSSIFACVLLIIGVFVFTALFQFYRLTTIAGGVKDALQSAVISSANDNWSSVWNGVRQGYSGAYRTGGNSNWTPSFTSGDIYGRLDELLGLNSSHMKFADGEPEFKIYGLSVKVINTVFAPDTHEIEQFEILSKLTLEVPMSFGGDVLPPMKINLQLKSKYMAKF